MMNLKNKISVVAGGIGGYIVSTYTNLEASMKILIIFMVLDFVLGFANAYTHKQLTSNKMFQGAVRKGIVFVIIIVAHHLAITANVPSIKEMTVVYYVAMETLSIFEHAVAFDVPLPAVLTKLAERLKNENDEGDVN